MGTIHAESMDDAVARIARRGGITLTTPPPDSPFADPKWMQGGQEVSILVWASPEHFFRHHLITHNPP
jgi:hypothetical protein